MSLLTMYLDNTRFRRIEYEVDPPRVERLHYIIPENGTIMQKRRRGLEPADEYAGLFDLTPGDHVLVVQNGDEQATEQFIFVCPNAETRRALAEAIRNVFHIHDHEIKRG